jgi:hypothetical protein
MDNGHPLQLIPNEIQEVDLMDINDQGGEDQNLEQQPIEIEENVMQLDFVELLQNEGDHVFLARMQQNFFR